MLIRTSGLLQALVLGGSTANYAQSSEEASTKVEKVNHAAENKPLASEKTKQYSRKDPSKAKAFAKGCQKQPGQGRKGLPGRCQASERHKSLKQSGKETSIGCPARV